MRYVRLAWDDVAGESVVMDTIGRLLDKGFPRSKVRVYVLVNYKDSPDDAMYRCEKLKSMGILPNVQRYQPLDTLSKDSYVAPGWQRSFLKIFVKYWSRQIYYSKVPFEEYRY